MTLETEKAINNWLDIHCKKCVENDDRGTDSVNCQAGCEIHCVDYQIESKVQKDIGIICIHYEESHDMEQYESEKDK